METQFIEECRNDSHYLINLYEIVIMKIGEIFEKYNIKRNDIRILNKILDEKFYFIAQEYYFTLENSATDLPYHNFWHALKVILNAYNIIQNCKNEWEKIDEISVYLALLFHDAWYSKDQTKFGFKLKEEYSVSIAEKCLNWLVDKDKIKKIKTLIMSTYTYWTFNNIEEKIVRSSDLAWFAWDYDFFIDENKKLFEEYNILNPKKITVDDWKTMTKELADFYYNQDIHLTSLYKYNKWNSSFHIKIKQNVDRFLNSWY